MRRTASRGTRARGTERAVAGALPILLCVLLGGATLACADVLPRLGIVPSPPVVTPAEVGAHVGDIVVLEANVAAATVEGGRIELRPEGAHAGNVRVIIVPPLIGESPRRIASRFPGKDVRVAGRVHEFDGRYEILTSDPDRVTILGEDVAEREGETAKTTDAPGPAASVGEAAELEAGARPRGGAPLSEPVAPGPGALPAAAPPAVLGASDAGVPAAGATTGVPAAGATTAEPAEAPAAQGASVRAEEAAARPTPDACGAARSRWKDAAAAARGALASLSACLARGVPPCATELERMRPALAEVAAAEERLAWLCRPGP